MLLGLRVVCWLFSLATGQLCLLGGPETGSVAGPASCHAALFTSPLHLWRMGCSFLRGRETEARHKDRLVPTFSKLVPTVKYLDPYIRL